MKPLATTAPNVEIVATDADKPDGGAAILRPSRICILTVLSTPFWAIIFYFYTPMQGNVVALLKPSTFSFPFLSGARLRAMDCAGRRIYMYDLPARFNDDLLRNCRAYSRSTDMCKHVVNGGFGPALGDEGGVFPARGAYNTDQFLLEVIFHVRMKRYECLTNHSIAADAVYVPFYAGFDAAMNLWKPDISARDALSHDLVEWLVSRPEWRVMGGRDHFLVLGRGTWDFLRREDTQWGNGLLIYPAVRNMTALTNEASPWNGNDYAIPFPSHFHPSSDADVFSWQDRMRRSDRKWLFCFAGSPRPGNTQTIRAQIINQCSKSTACSLLGKLPGNNSPPGWIMRLLESSTFCLQPRGDAFTRKSTFDSLLAGCIPVFFHPASAYVQYVWHLPRDYRRYSVFIPHTDVTGRNVSIEETLRAIPPETVAKMREEVIGLIPRVMYADPASRLETLKDAFDVAVEKVIARVAKRRRAMADGREYVDSVDGRDSWKYDLGEDGEKAVGPHEFDPFL